MIFVGSTNPVKINAVLIAASETWPEVTAEGFDVPSGIAEQPRSDHETRQGAENRARAALAAGLERHPELQNKGSANNPVLGIGLEGGVFDQGTELWSTVWIVAVDQADHLVASNGARFQVPQVFAEPIRSGAEMGPIVAEITGHTNVKQKSGMIGVITNGFVDRTEEYAGITKMALGLWYGQVWRQTADGYSAWASDRK